MSIWSSLAPHDVRGIKDWDKEDEPPVTIDVATNGGMDPDNPIRVSIWHTNAGDDWATLILDTDAARAVAAKLIQAADYADRAR